MLDGTALAVAGGLALAETEAGFANATANRGLEKLFSGSLQRHLIATQGDINILREQPRESWSKSKYFKYYDKEKIDLSIIGERRKTGIEIKVCKLPRTTSLSDWGRCMI